ncbi:MAG TPA: N-acetylmuramoyl-L-alanine amidase [Pseudolabrys sp.]|nr:N-acetylmuramoyl-L-alanine amidase [Pseudolabrys sp.]
MKARLVLLLALATPLPALCASLPPIIAGAGNEVPKCVAPDTLMDFVAATNAARRAPGAIEPRFAHIASLYQTIGACVARPPESCVAVRWDYAFFQMLIETNYLTFRRPDGAPAAVPASDNNFAGLGATVSGRPGEHFDDVKTGVLAHLQHVLMYSTMRIPQPVAKRTRQVQNDVQDMMRRLRRPVTFADLAREWTGTDKNTYGRDMQRLAEKYAQHYCDKQQLTAR